MSTYRELLRKSIKLQEKARKIEVPWSVWTAIWDKKPWIEIAGDKISLGSDHKNLDEVREAIEWLANQFGGQIKWKKEGE